MNLKEQYIYIYWNPDESLQHIAATWALDAETVLRFAYGQTGAGKTHTMCPRDVRMLDLPVPGSDAKELGRATGLVDSWMGLYVWIFATGEEMFQPYFNKLFVAFLGT